MATSFSGGGSRNTRRDPRKDTKKGGHLGKNHAPPLLQVKWSVPNYNFEFVDTTEGGEFYNGTRRRMFLLANINFFIRFAELRTIVTGFVDTLQMLKKLLPDLESYKQANVYKHNF
jgi:hypothetical protein